MFPAQPWCQAQDCVQKKKNAGTSESRYFFVGGISPGSWRAGPKPRDLAKKPSRSRRTRLDETRHFCPVRQRDSPRCPLLQGHLFIFFFIHNAWKVPDISDPVPGQTLTHVFTSDFSFHYLSTKVSLCRTGSSVSSDKMSNILNIKIDRGRC